MHGNFNYCPAFHPSSHLEEGGEIILKPKRILYRRFILCGAKAPQKGRCPFRTGRRTEKYLLLSCVPSKQSSRGRRRNYIVNITNLPSPPYREKTAAINCLNARKAVMHGSPCPPASLSSSPSPGYTPIGLTKERPWHRS